MSLSVDDRRERRDFRLNWDDIPYAWMINGMPDEDYRIDVDIVEDGDFYRVTPREDLPVGEYALLDERQYLYDFSIEE